MTAYRLAEAGLSVCVLERGKAYPPGEFPRAPHRMQRNFWDPSEGLHGMYNIWSFSELGAVVCSGLGGGSLIYANVLIRKPEKWFVKEDLHGGGFEYWPVTRADLDPHYDRVEKMLGAQQVPDRRATVQRGAQGKRVQGRRRAAGARLATCPSSPSPSATKARSRLRASLSAEGSGT